MTPPMSEDDQIDNKRIKRRCRDAALRVICLASKSYSADRQIPLRYKNTAIIAEEVMQRLIVEHELGHLLTRAGGHHDDASNLMSSLVGQLSPAGEEALEAKRLSQVQEDQIYRNPAVKKVAK